MTFPVPVSLRGKLRGGFGDVNERATSGTIVGYLLALVAGLVLVTIFPWISTGFL